MGIQGLLPVLKPITRCVHISNYKGRRVAIDGYSWLHKAVYSCSMELCMGQWTDKHVQFCLARVDMLRQHGVEPLLVFDGAQLPTKAEEEETRRRSRKENLDRALAFLQAGNKTAAEQAFQRAVDVTPAMAKLVIEELKTRNVHCLVAPYEADAQMAYLAMRGDVHAVITEDSDLLTYGCPRVLFKLDRTGNGEEVVLEDLKDNTGLTFVGWDHTMFQEMCIMSGCDFLPNIPGIGIKKSHGQIKKWKSFVKACKNLRFSGQVSVPQGYEERFQRALWVFRHQRVYCQDAHALVHLNPLPKGGLGAANVDVQSALPLRPPSGVPGELPMEDLDFLGPDLDPSTAQGIAEGHLDPFTQQPFDLAALYRGCRHPPAHIKRLLDPDQAEGPQSGTSISSQQRPSGAAAAAQHPSAGGKGHPQQPYTTLYDLGRRGSGSAAHVVKAPLPHGLDRSHSGQGHGHGSGGRHSLHTASGHAPGGHVHHGQHSGGHAGAQQHHSSGHAGKVATVRARSMLGRRARVHAASSSTPAPACKGSIPQLFAAAHNRSVQLLSAPFVPPTRPSGGAGSSSQGPGAALPDSDAATPQPAAVAEGSAGVPPPGSTVQPQVACDGELQAEAPRMQQEPTLACADAQGDAGAPGKGLVRGGPGSPLSPVRPSKVPRGGHSHIASTLFQALQPAPAADAQVKAAAEGDATLRPVLRDVQNLQRFTCGVPAGSHAAKAGTRKGRQQDPRSVQPTDSVEQAATRQIRMADADGDQGRVRRGGVSVLAACSSGDGLLVPVGLPCGGGRLVLGDSDDSGRLDSGELPRPAGRLSELLSSGDSPPLQPSMDRPAALLFGEFAMQPQRLGQPQPSLAEQLTQEQAASMQAAPASTRARLLRPHWAMPGCEDEVPVGGSGAEGAAIQHLVASDSVGTQSPQGFTPAGAGFAAEEQLCHYQHHQQQQQQQQELGEAETEGRSSDSELRAAGTGSGSGSDSGFHSLRHVRQYKHLAAAVLDQVQQQQPAAEAVAEHPGGSGEVAVCGTDSLRDHMCQPRQQQREEEREQTGLLGLSEQPGRVHSAGSLARVLDAQSSEELKLVPGVGSAGSDSMGKVVDVIDVTGEEDDDGDALLGGQRAVRVGAVSAKGLACGLSGFTCGSKAVGAAEGAVTGIKRFAVPWRTGGGSGGAAAVGEGGTGGWQRRAHVAGLRRPSAKAGAVSGGPGAGGLRQSTLHGRLNTPGTAAGGGRGGGGGAVAGAGAGRVVTGGCQDLRRFALAPHKRQRS